MREIHVSIVVPQSGDIDVRAVGNVPRSGFLGPIVLALCAVALPPGSYSIRCHPGGDPSLSATCEAGRQAEAYGKLADAARETRDLAARLAA